MTVPIKATTTEVRQCKSKCKSEFQDQKYGKGIRVMNSTRNKTVGGFKCTVCGTVQ